MNESAQNLLEVWNNLVDHPVELTYRIYYDPVTGETTRTDTELFDEPHIVVDKETYNAFNSYIQIVVDGQLVARPSGGTGYAKQLSKSADGDYVTMRNRAMFPAADTDNVDKWRLE
jgi:hypothetical protein